MKVGDKVRLTEVGADYLKRNTDAQNVHAGATGTVETGGSDLVTVRFDDIPDWSISENPVGWSLLVGEEIELIEEA